MPRGEGIKKLSNLFDKYKNTLIAPERSVKQVFCEVVKDLYGWDVPFEVITYTPSSKTLSIQSSGALKSEIQIHHQEIITHMKGRLGERSAPKKII